MAAVKKPKGISQMQADEFLSLVWSNQPRGEYVCLSKKTEPTLKEDKSVKNGDVGSWSDHFFTTVEEAVEWINKQSKNDDIYFCATWLTEKRRLKENVVDTKFLWADLDECDPNDLEGDLRPTIAWESSPGRYQGLWQLQKPASPKETEEANRAIAYALKEFGADKGGWDLSQALRIPGRRNNRYKERPVTRLLWNDRRTTSIAKIKLAIGVSTVQETDLNFEPENNKDMLSFEQVLSRKRKKIPPKLIALLLATRAPEGHRSDVLWSLGHGLIKAGLSRQETFTLLKGSVWNKYSGRRDEDERLSHEIFRAIEDEVLSDFNPLDEKRQKKVEAIDEEEFEKPKFVIKTDKEVMMNPAAEPGWLIKGFWTKASHGIVAGEPKSFKSTIVLDLAVSVSSGEPFLGKFPVEEKGTVLIIQNENADWVMKDRLTKIRNHKGLNGKATKVSENHLRVDFPKALPIHYINQQGFQLTDGAHQEWLEETIELLKPSVVILDPLYLMFEGDLNSAKELNPMLSWLLSVKIRFNTGIIVIHHFNKGGAQNSNARGGQKMLGSTTLHGWTESSWFLNTKTVEGSPAPDESGDEDFTKPTALASVTIEREFRGAGMHPKVDLVISMGEFGDPSYNVDIKKHEPPTPKGTKKKLEKPSISKLRADLVSQMATETKPWTEAKMASYLGVDETDIQQVVDKLLAEGAIELIEGKGYKLVA